MTVDRTETRRCQPVGERIPTFFHPLVREFYTQVLNGRLPEISVGQIGTMVRELFLSTRPLTPLTSKEEAILIEYVIDSYENYFSDSTWKLMAGGVVYRPPRPGLRRGKILMGKSMGQERVLSPVELERILIDPSIYQSVEVEHESPQGGRVSGNGISMPGTRNLYGSESYGFTIDSFRVLLYDVRKRQGKASAGHLRGLDIGGSNGLAAHDAEELDTFLDMTNLTTRPALGSWLLRGGHILVPAERMPANFHERFDVIISNMAFCYMRFPDVSLRNAVHALNVGGILKISFNVSRDRSLERKEFVERVDKQFKWMADLEKKGVIEFIPLPEGRSDAYKNWQEKTNDDFVPGGILHLRKTKSLVRH